MLKNYYVRPKVKGMRRPLQALNSDTEMCLMHHATNFINTLRIVHKPLKKGVSQKKSHVNMEVASVRVRLTILVKSPQLRLHVGHTVPLNSVSHL